MSMRREWCDFRAHLTHFRSCDVKNVIFLKTAVTPLYNISFWPTTYDEIKNKRYNCKIHGLYTGAMYIQTNVSSSWATVRSSKRLFVYTLHLYINHESYNYSVCF